MLISFLRLCLLFYLAATRSGRFLRLCGFLLLALSGGFRGGGLPGFAILLWKGGIGGTGCRIWVQGWSVLEFPSPQEIVRDGGRIMKGDFAILEGGGSCCAIKKSKEGKHCNLHNRQYSQSGAVGQSRDPPFPRLRTSRD